MRKHDSGLIYVRGLSGGVVRCLR